MCGFAGTLSYRSAVDRELLERMVSCIGYRGPDQGAVRVFEAPDLAVGLGARRLSIRDLGAGGDQPMSAADDQVWLAYNGELYNDAALRRDLEARGHRFRSASDTETVLRAYLEWGADALPRLSGMFAFAVFDARARSLLLARDRMGIKPLYWWWDGATLLFGSELKTLLLSPQVDRRIDPVALDLYFELCYVPSPRSIVAAVQKLVPGTYLRFQAGRVQQHAFNPLHRAVQPADRLPPAALSEITHRTVGDAVGRQLVADVPVGVFLSGGIDSTVVALEASARRAAPIDTFSVRYALPGEGGGAVRNGEANEDAAYARIVAGIIGARHHEVLVDVTDDAADVLESVVEQLGEPLVEATSIPLLFLSRAAREAGVPVVLTGDGADELFAGYPWYLYAARLERYQRVPFARQLAAVLGAGAPFGTVRTRARDLRHMLDLDVVGRYREIHQRFGTLTPEDRRLVLAPDASQPAGDAVTSLLVERLAPVGGQPLPDQLAWLDLSLWVREHFNHRLDRMTMAHSVEARVPFQDDEVIDLALRIPAAHKMPGGRLKFLLRDAFKRQIPEAVLRRPKRPFVGPYREWLDGPLRDFARAALAPAALNRFGILDGAGVARLLAQYDAGGTSAARIWTLLVLQVWCERYLGRDWSRSWGGDSGCVVAARK